jgi:hypothetical protein
MKSIKLIITSIIISTLILFTWWSVRSVRADWKWIVDIEVVEMIRVGNWSNEGDIEWTSNSSYGYNDIVIYEGVYYVMYNPNYIIRYIRPSGLLGLFFWRVYEE